MFGSSHHRKKSQNIVRNISFEFLVEFSGPKTFIFFKSVVLKSHLSLESCNRLNLLRLGQVICELLERSLPQFCFGPEVGS